MAVEIEVGHIEAIIVSRRLDARSHVTDGLERLCLALPADGDAGDGAFAAFRRDLPVDLEIEGWQKLADPRFAKNGGAAACRRCGAAIARKEGLIALHKNGFHLLRQRVKRQEKKGHDQPCLYPTPHGLHLDAFTLNAALHNSASVKRDGLFLLHRAPL